MQYPDWGTGCSRARWVLLVLGAFFASVVLAAPQDISSLFAVTRGGLLLNRITNTFDALTNGEVIARKVLGNGVSHVNHPLSPDDDVDARAVHRRT